MKKALNNPLVVGVLVLLALAFVLRDFIHLSSIFSSKPDQSHAVATLPQAVRVMPVQPKAAPTVHQGAPTRLARSDWAAVAAIPLTHRDPFSPQAVVVPLHHPQARIDDSNEEAAVAGFPVMDLRAIVSAADVHYASINGKLCEVGALIDGWELVAIGVNRVQLRGEQGLLTLDIDGGARLGGKPLKMAKNTIVSQAVKPQNKAAAPATSTSIPNSVGELNMYQGLFDSLIKSGVVPDMKGLK